MGSIELFEILSVGDYLTSVVKIFGGKRKSARGFGIFGNAHSN